VTLNHKLLDKINKWIEDGKKRNLRNGKFRFLVWREDTAPPGGLSFGSKAEVYFSNSELHYYPGIVNLWHIGKIVKLKSFLLTCLMCHKYVWLIYIVFFLYFNNINIESLGPFLHIQLLFFTSIAQLYARFLVLDSNKECIFPLITNLESIGWKFSLRKRVY